MKNYIKTHPYDFSFILISGLTAIVVGVSLIGWLMMGLGYSDDPPNKMSNFAYAFSLVYPVLWGVLLLFRNKTKKEPVIKIRNLLTNGIQTILIGSWILAVWSLWIFVVEFKSFL